VECPADGACSILVAAAESLAQQQERADRAGDDRDRGRRMAIHLAPQAAILVVRFVGEILGRVRQLPPIVVAATTEALLDAPAPAFNEVLRTAAGAIRVVAYTLAGTSGGVADLLFDFTVAHGGTPRHMDAQAASVAVTEA